MSVTSKSAAADVAKYLTDAGYTSLYVNYMPDTPDSLTTIYDSGGPSSDKAMGSLNVVFELPRVQVVTRHSNATTAHNNAFTFYRLLDGLASQTINDNTYDLMSCEQTPFLLGRDENNRERYAFNVQIIRKPA